MSLKPGDIVTDLDQNSCLEGRQGLVERIQLRLWDCPEVTVRFDRELYPYYLRNDEYVDGFYDVYPPHQLRRDEDWEPAVYARRLFGSNWHTVSALKEPLNPDHLCPVEGCACKQRKTIWFNAWGEVRNAHVCDQHARDYHGKCGDQFPWRKRASA